MRRSRPAFRLVCACARPVDVHDSCTARPRDQSAVCRLRGLTAEAWLNDSELRIGLGCMRLATGPGFDQESAAATIAAAVEAGVTVFDTARAYTADPAELGQNERMLGRVLSGVSGARVVTKGGMRRPGGGWVPDGRAKAIAADCEASLEALGGIAIDLYLLHAPDPRTSWRTSVRALARLAEQGLVRRVGVSNVNRDQLDEACELAPVAAVQVAFSRVDDSPVRGGVVARCAERGIAVIAHSPLGGPRRSAALAHDPALVEVAGRLGATVEQVALAWLLSVSPVVVPIPGARRPETVRSAVHAGAMLLADEDRATLAGPRPGPVRAARRAAAEVVVVMGIAGAGKSRRAAEYVDRGYARLNRDELGGSLRDLAIALDEQLTSGASSVVLDNTYLTRVARSHVLDVAARHGAAARCVWIDTPLDQAQVNLVQRLLDRFGSLPTPEELRAAARGEPGLMLPTSQMRTLRELEPPSADEGFVAVERVEFARESGDVGAGGVLVAAAALARRGVSDLLAGADPAAPHLLFDWRPGGSADGLDEQVRLLSRLVSGPVEVGVCPHGGGPPSCWCRPPLPGLPLAFARRRRLDLSLGWVIGASPAHGTLARTLGARYVEA